MAEAETAHESSVPTVQIPVSAEHHCLSIDGTRVYAWPKDREHPGDENISGHPGGPHLPERANEAYWNHMVKNGGYVFQCVECGYLTMSRKAKASSLETYACPNCDDSGTHQTKWRRVHPSITEDEPPLDVMSLEPNDVPNHVSHLSRIQNRLETYVERSEMLDTVAEAVAEARSKGYVDY